MAIRASTITIDIGSVTLTYSHEVQDGPPGRFLVVTVQINSDTVTGVTYNGVSMSQQISHNNGLYITYIFTLADPDMGIHDVVISTGGALNIASCAVTFHGVNVVTPVAATVSNDGTTDPATVTISNRNPDQLIIDSVVAQTLGLTVGAGQRQLALPGLGALEEGGTSTEPGATGDVVMSWADATIVSWAIVAMAMNEEPKTVIGIGAQFGPQVFVKPTRVSSY